MEKVELMSNLDRLFLNVKEYRSSAHYKQMMEFCGKFKHLAPYNAMLVQMQKPSARFVLKESEWLNNYHRRIKPNAQPLIILAPFGPVDFVFDIGDTYLCKEKKNQLLIYEDDDRYLSEEKILEQLAHPYKTNVNMSEEFITDVLKKCAIHGIAFDMKMNAAPDFAAKIELIETDLEKLEIPLNTNTFIDYDAHYLISVNKNAETGEQMASIAHELGHLFCRHLVAPKSWKRWRWVRLEHEVQEFEAESVSWLISERLGIKNPSEDYLSGYMSTYDEIPSGISIERIFVAFNHAWKLMKHDARPTYKDGLPYKYDENFKLRVRDKLKDSKTKHSREHPATGKW